MGRVFPWKAHERPHAEGRRFRLAQQRPYTIHRWSTFDDTRSHKVVSPWDSASAVISPRDGWLVGKQALWLRQSQGSPIWSVVKMLATILIWLGRCLLVLLALATFAPLAPTGAWFVRGFDFPRVQFLSLMLLMLAAFSLHAWWAPSMRQGHALWIVLLLIAIGWQVVHIAPFTPLWPKEVADKPQGEAFRLMVANIEKDNTRHAEVLQVIENRKPDLLLLIEYHAEWQEALGSLKSEYPHRTEVVRDEGLGIALWSKLPTFDVEVKHLVSERRASIFATVALPDGRQLRFAGVHPTPPGLEDSTPGGRRDSRVRDAELVLVAEEVKHDSETPWIVAGDFNDVAWSRTTQLFKRLSGLRDPRVGRALLNTYHADYPVIRFPIDQVFLTEGSGIEPCRGSGCPVPTISR